MALKVTRYHRNSLRYELQLGMMVTPIVPASQEAQAGGRLEARSLGQPGQQSITSGL